MKNENIGDMTRTELIDYVIELQEINSRYERKIDKAIEYINKLQENDDIEIWREDGYWAYILNILQGSDKE